MSNVSEIQDVVEDVVIDLGYVAVILDQVSDSFSLDKKNWSEKEICKMIENHSQLASMISLCIKLIGDSVESFNSVIESNDSDESEAPTETTKNQK